MWTHKSPKYILKVDLLIKRQYFEHKPSSSTLWNLASILNRCYLDRNNHLCPLLCAPAVASLIWIPPNFWQSIFQRGRDMKCAVLRVSPEIWSLLFARRQSNRRRSARTLKPPDWYGGQSNVKYKNCNCWNPKTVRLKWIQNKHYEKIINEQDDDDLK